MSLIQDNSPIMEDVIPQVGSFKVIRSVRLRGGIIRCAHDPLGG
jgi:hypothetical protein